MTLLDTAAQAPIDAPVVPAVPSAIPRRGSALGRLVGRVGLSLFGWKVVGSFPDLPKALIIVAPHTSNWDFIAGFWAYLALDLHANWFGKHTLFVWPFGAILRRFGGIPVHRESRVARQVVDVYVEAYQSRDRMLLAIAPEGTRRRVEEWKSGFHRIALGAGVPIVPVALDYRLSRVIVGEPFVPTSDWELDVMQIKARYAGVTPKHPHLF
ncbi:MAG: 1-acyl-sn-glycerol-3-phosphate acyltransferase [Gemmatimonadaceae bacterium]|nr:1-acyl-sn-glycerol-3-phosphate acyltransferase [Gemmatimonadaceae bacterium]